MPLKRIFLIISGSLALILGFIGIIVPVLPTTPFLLLAAFCYLRSCETLYKRLTEHRVFGSYIYNYITYKAVKKRVKTASLVFLWLSLGISACLVNNLHVRILLGVIGIGVSIHLLKLKTLNILKDNAMNRTFNYDIMPEIKQRWSARAYSAEQIAKDEIVALLEAARYAPSCFNEQPWRFLVADDEETLEKMRGILTPKNQSWANKAPVLILIASKKNFEYDGKKNYWNMFDAGTAWGYLSLEAQKRGLITHAMGGFDREKARSVFNLADDLNIITVVAVGRYGLPESLSDELREQEFPQTREEIKDLLLN
jgi:uncharacterized membrane protein YbaN (DUF454 family)/nitroreductase